MNKTRADFSLIIIIEQIINKENTYSIYSGETINIEYTALSISGEKANDVIEWRIVANNSVLMTIEEAKKAGYITSTSKKFTKKTSKKVLVSKQKKTSQAIKNLKGKKTYYVRIRTYKNVKFNGKTVKVYSTWSKSKSAKTK